MLKHSTSSSNRNTTNNNNINNNNSSSNNKHNDRIQTKATRFGKLHLGPLSSSASFKAEAVNVLFWGWFFGGRGGG